MKISKLYLLLCLGFFVTQTTLAFQEPEPKVYMQILVVYKGFKTTIFSISASGDVEEQKTNSVSDGFTIRPDKVATIQLEIQSLLNKYAKEGWVLKEISNLSGEGIVTSSYYLEKNLEE